MPKHIVLLLIREKAAGVYEGAEPPVLIKKDQTAV
jgi:hypothetical protein